MWILKNGGKITLVVQLNYSLKICLKFLTNIDLCLILLHFQFKTHRVMREGIFGGKLIIIEMD
jgi:hypothetical protein